MALARGVVLSLLWASASGFSTPGRVAPGRLTGLLAKKSKAPGGGGGGKGGGGKDRQNSFDAQTRQYAFTLSKLTKVLGTRTVLDKVDLAFFHGAKIGVVGGNGSGKSTLMKIMAGVDPDFNGVAKPGPGLSVGYLAQEPDLEGETVEDAINPAVEKSRAVLREFEEISERLGSLQGEALDAAMDEMTRVQDVIDAGDLWELDRRVQIATEALRCPPLEAKNAVLSGGERRRVALARLLLENHDMLLLDEPTNHLDAESVAWLERYLADFKGTVVVITHDRYFLERITEWILEIDQGKGLPFEGSYAQWLEHKANALTTDKAADLSRKAAFLAELKSFKDKSGASARLDNYDTLLEAGLTLDASQALFIPNGPRLGTDIIKIDRVSKSFGDRVLFDDATFEIPRGAVVGIVGANGAGKSTLVRILAGLEQPDGGTVTIGSTVKLATVAQARDELESRGADASLFEAICDGMDTVELGTSFVPARQYVSRFGFASGAQSKKVSMLSGGERNRAFLARILRANANVLVLDEPTNDLDVSTLRSLEDAILAFAGCVLAVSHDRFFLDRVATHILAFEPESKVVFFKGNWREYEADRVSRLGADAPKPAKYKKLVAA
ncbi:P-loop containing nucleoside triphosphate hydrolase protein [Pelagophyceae sp. CCMP2097]|nr:P-loop containing nucleoside triphosphate hydrolase protein [Pelagophyceae sp. CCMP2097]